MTKDQIEAIIKTVVEEEVNQFEPPSQSDWINFENKFSCTFSNEFKNFIELMSQYSFPGDILNVSTGSTNGNDSIEFTYEYELSQENWNPDMIPFYSVGNGDYFCLSKMESPNSPVYYYYHEDFRTEYYSDSFENWIRELPEFLS
ncbi:SMI1 / KNR4 family protein [compost metagenome]